MRAAKHTPGPWVALPEESDRAYIRIRGTRLGDRYKIANVLSLAYPGNEIVQEREAEVSRANASLIAAAPELLEALELVTYCLHWHHERNGRDSKADHNALTAARAVLALATRAAQ